MYDLVAAISDAELRFRAGQIGQARALVEDQLRAAPHRQTRVLLRLMLSTHLAAVGLLRAAAEVARAALQDLASVSPSGLSGEVYSQLAAVEIDTDPHSAIAHAGAAVAAAQTAGEIAEAGRYLTLRAQLRIQAARTAGRRPMLDQAAVADLQEAAGLLAAVPTTHARLVMVRPVGGWGCGLVGCRWW